MSRSDGISITYAPDRDWLTHYRVKVQGDDAPPIKPRWIRARKKAG
jgi:hypothetical protein